MAIAADVVGQTKVQGYEYLNEGLAHSLFRRHVEKNRSGRRATFANDHIHYARTSPNGFVDGYNVLYSQVRKFYTFSTQPNILMLAIDGDCDGRRIYQSLQFQDLNDIPRVKRLIRGAQGSRRRRRSLSSSYYPGPAEQVVYEQPAYQHVSRVYQASPPPPPPQTYYLERVEPVSAVPVVERVEPVPIVERVERAPVIERVQKVPTVIRERSPSPAYVKTITAPPPAPPSTYFPPLEVYVGDSKPVETVVYKTVEREAPVKPIYLERVEPVPVVNRVEAVPTVTRQRSPSPIYVQTVQPVQSQPPSFSRPTEYYVAKPVQEPVVMRRQMPRQSTSPIVMSQPSPNVIYDEDDDDSSLILRRVSRVPPT